MEEEKDTQKEPNDLQQFCRFHKKDTTMAPKWHQKQKQIIDMMLEVPLEAR